MYLVRGIELSSTGINRFECLSFTDGCAQMSINFNHKFHRNARALSCARALWRPLIPQKDRIKPRLKRDNKIALQFEIHPEFIERFISSWHSWHRSFPTGKPVFRGFVRDLRNVVASRIVKLETSMFDAMRAVVNSLFICVCKKGSRCSLYRYFHYASLPLPSEFALYRARFHKNTNAAYQSEERLDVRGRSILFERRENFSGFPRGKYISHGFNRDALYDSIIFTGFVNGSVCEYRAAGLASCNPSSHEGQ